MGDHKFGMPKSSLSASPLYCLGFIGAAVYYIKNAQNPKEKVVGIGKSIIWPATIVHGLLKLLARI